jgi:hypothetical protein
VTGCIGVEEIQKRLKNLIFNHEYFLKSYRVIENFSLLIMMDTPLKVLKLNFRIGYVDYDRGTLRKY